MAQQLSLEPRPLQIVTHVRKLRGGSQAHLVQTDDGCYYAIKAENNPLASPGADQRMVRGGTLASRAVAGPRSVGSRNYAGMSLPPS